MTRAKLWELLQTAVPGVRRIARAGTDAPAVIFRETLRPRPDHRMDELTLDVVIPVPRALPGLADDSRARALRAMCLDTGVAYAQNLAPDEAWGCPVYTCTLTAQVTRDGG